MKGSLSHMGGSYTGLAVRFSSGAIRCCVGMQQAFLHILGGRSSFEPPICYGR